jgi:hypothetical protein
VRQADRQRLPRPPWPKEIPLPNFENIYAQLRTLIEIAQQEMDAIRLAVISPHNAPFFEQDELFGKDVKDKAFPQINSEIKAVGNCLAADLNSGILLALKFRC